MSLPFSQDSISKYKPSKKERRHVILKKDTKKPVLGSLADHQMAEGGPCHLPQGFILGFADFFL
jgi:hypothetical protein